MMNPPLALLDTTVFCGALVKPDGFNMRLLKFGATPLYRPLISQTVIAEFIHKAVVDGIGKDKRQYTPEEIGLFLESFGNIIDPATAKAVGETYKYVVTVPANTPLWVILSKYTTTWPNESDVSKQLNIPIGKTDPGDFHIGLAVIQYHPDILVTSNIKDLAYLNQLCQVLTPSQFLRIIDALE